MCTPIMDSENAAAAGSSLFDLTGKKVAAAGSSVTSYVCEPNPDENRAAKRVNTCSSV